VINNGEAVLRSAGRAPSDAELKELLRARRGSRKELAKVLGISERTLYRRLKSLQRQ